MNCIDINTEERVYSWIISISCPMATVSQVYSVNVRFNLGKVLYLHFTNPTRYKAYLNIKSSNEQLLQIVTNKIVVESQEICEIKMIAKSN